LFPFQSSLKHLNNILLLICRQIKESAPTTITRRAILKAKREAIRHLAAIKAEVDRKCEEVSQQLDERKQAARDLVLIVEPLETELADAQAIAKNWAHRGEGPGKSDAVTPGRAPPPDCLTDSFL